MVGEVVIPEAETVLLTCPSSRRPRIGLLDLLLLTTVQYVLLAERYVKSSVLTMSTFLILTVGGLIWFHQSSQVRQPDTAVDIHLSHEVSSLFPIIGDDAKWSQGG